MGNGFSQANMTLRTMQISELLCIYNIKWRENSFVLLLCVDLGTMKTECDFWLLLLFEGTYLSSFVFPLFDFISFDNVYISSLNHVDISKAQTLKGHVLNKNQMTFQMIMSIEMIEIEVNCISRDSTPSYYFYAYLILATTSIYINIMQWGGKACVRRQE